MVFEAENVRDWRDHDVVDASGDKVGTLEAIYFDTGTDEPAFASVTIGMLGRKRLAFAPLTGAVVSPDYLKVTATKKQIKDSPSIDTDGELTSEQEPELYQHYGLEYQPGVGGERRLGRR
ncbi:PRC-barrel domain-containing protein [Leekyejoonella antrihumi]|uniref:PRC-barrel domain containing protein n=1 Tax=Leekyejoonella antrihumi TaxID=1660198 RepID=A0A563DUG1_9MICO|nr:PRC-barrel domain-containing protein [Leekyejoonella antrihumi]TWP33897.1 PRC-barrel domain containing protein [Leekyejoonella antrihumi]